MFENSRSIWNVREMPLCWIWSGRRPAIDSPLEQDVTGVGLVETRDQVERRRLARAVGTDDREDLVLVDLERELVDGLEATEGLGRTFEVEYYFGHRSHLQVLMALFEVEDLLARLLLLARIVVVDLAAPERVGQRCPRACR